MTPGALLTMADYHGTLAAVRSLGRAGVAVTVADAHRFAPARFSRYAVESVSCPSVDEPERFVDWLLETGKRTPGRVLYGTSDDVTFLVAQHADELARHYRLYTPPVDVVYTLLNKARLHRACVDHGVDAPETRLADDAGTMTMPVVLKPQTQILLSPHQKGRVVHDAADLAATAQEFRRAAHHSSCIVAFDPGVRTPVAQSFVASAASGIYNLSGFVDPQGTFVAEASRKLLQWPRRLGIGLLFEEAEVVPEVADAVARLCRRIGYFGAFEVELLEVAGRHLLIDFNPRFYGQMQFDIARGLDLPRLVYLAAIGDRPALARAMDDARRHAGQRRGRVYESRIDLEIVLQLLRAAGTLDPSERRRIRTWLEVHRDAAADAVLDRDDWVPAAIEAAIAFRRVAAHPRSAWRAARNGR